MECTTADDFPTVSFGVMETSTDHVMQSNHARAPKMPEPFLVNVSDRQPLKGAGDERAVTRFLGPSQETGPWVYLTKRPAGERVPAHRHSANRTEFLIEGVIDWKEPRKPAMQYGAGTLSYVEANTVYSYDVVEDATILLWFDAAPGTSWI